MNTIDRINTLPGESFFDKEANASVSKKVLLDIAIRAEDTKNEVDMLRPQIVSFKSVANTVLNDKVLEKSFTGLSTQMLNSIDEVGAAARHAENSTLSAVKKIEEGLSGFVKDVFTANAAIVLAEKTLIDVRDFIDLRIEKATKRAESRNKNWEAVVNARESLMDVREDAYSNTTDARYQTRVGAVDKSLRKLMDSIDSHEKKDRRLADTLTGIRRGITVLIDKLAERCDLTLEIQKPMKAVSEGKDFSFTFDEKALEDELKEERM